MHKNRILHLNLQPEAVLLKTRPNYLQDPNFSRAISSPTSDWKYLIQLKLGGFNRATSLFDKSSLAISGEEIF